MGNRSITKINLFLSQLRTRIVIGVVHNDAYIGTIQKPLCNFKYKINFITLYRDRVQIPSKSLQPDFVKDLFICRYMRLLKLVNIMTVIMLFCGNSSRTVNAAFAFDLTPQLD